MERGGSSGGCGGGCGGGGGGSGGHQDFVAMIPIQRIFLLSVVYSKSLVPFAQNKTGAKLKLLIKTSEHGIQTSRQAFIFLWKYKDSCMFPQTAEKVCLLHIVS